MGIKIRAALVALALVTMSAPAYARGDDQATLCVQEGSLAAEVVKSRDLAVPQAEVLSTVQPRMQALPADYERFKQSIRNLYTGATASPEEVQAAATAACESRLVKP